jgi:predicted ABC-type ATPase
MPNSLPHISIIAGPNGSGKSTCGPEILKEYFQISEFINADTIATGLSAFQPEDVAIEASRIMLKRLKLLANRQANFAFETIKRRYKSSIRNFFSLYQPLADNWCIYDNSEINNPKLIANGKLKANFKVHLEPQWKLFESYQNEK